MSDGETTTGRSDAEGAAVAADAGIAVDTIAFGTAEGVIVDPATGERQPVPVAPEPLAEIAASTGGRAFEAVSLGELADAYADIGAVVGYEDSEHETSATGSWARDWACWPWRGRSPCCGRSASRDRTRSPTGTGGNPSPSACMRWRPVGG